MTEFKSTNQTIIGQVNEHFSQLELIKLYNLESTSIFRFNSKLKKTIHDVKAAAFNYHYRWSIF